MTGRTPKRNRKNARLAAALKELGHALLAVYPNADRAVLVVSQPHPFKDFSLPVVAPENGIPEPEGVGPGWGDRPAGER